MTSAKEIEKAVATLPESELKEFRAWFAEFDSDNWDAQIESDIESGKLADLGKVALEHHSTKETREM